MISFWKEVLVVQIQVLDFLEISLDDDFRVVFMGWRGGLGDFNVGSQGVSDGVATFGKGLEVFHRDEEDGNDSNLFSGEDSLLKLYGMILVIEGANTRKGVKLCLTKLLTFLLFDYIGLDLTIYLQQKQ